MPDSGFVSVDGIAKINETRSKVWHSRLEAEPNTMPSTIASVQMFLTCLESSRIPLDQIETNTKLQLPRKQCLESHEMSAHGCHDLERTLCMCDLHFLYYDPPK
jgi:hypothetical protein